MHRRRRRVHNEFHARRRRQTEVSHRNKTSRRSAVLGVDRYRVNTRDLDGLGYSVKAHLQVEDGVRAGIRNTPELLFTAHHMNYRGGVAGYAGREIGSGVKGNIVHREVALRNSPFGTAKVFPQPLERWLVADYQDAMPQAGHRRLYVVNAVNHQGTGCATLKSGFGKAVDVRMIPVESRRLVGWEYQAVTECALGIDQGL